MKYVVKDNKDDDYIRVYYLDELLAKCTNWTAALEVVRQHEMIQKMED